jgi:hypothetical protein
VGQAINQIGFSPTFAFLIFNIRTDMSTDGQSDYLQKLSIQSPGDCFTQPVASFPCFM